MPYDQQRHVPGPRRAWHQDHRRTSRSPRSATVELQPGLHRRRGRGLPAQRAPRLHVVPPTCSATNPRRRFDIMVRHHRPAGRASSPSTRRTRSRCATSSGRNHVLRHPRQRRQPRTATSPLIPKATVDSVGIRVSTTVSVRRRPRLRTIDLEVRRHQISDELLHKIGRSPSRLRSIRWCFANNEAEAPAGSSRIICRAPPTLRSPSDITIPGRSFFDVRINAPRSTT